ncbi:MAG: alginate export family protein, partial [Acidobacteriaceae bacterium]|nr:alginate export family protein [Acidobacteriaceae bacterium]
ARDGVIDHHIQGNNLYGVYASLDKLIPHSTLEPYVLWRVAPAGLRLPEKGNQLGALNEVTGGIHFAETAGPFDYDLEMNLQTGSLGPKSIDAWAGDWNAGYVIQKTAFKPGLFVEYNYASGNKNPAGSSWGTHDQIYPSAHDKMDFADQFGWRNIRDLRVGIQEKISRKWTLNQVVDNVWLATKYDAMYNNSGAIAVAAYPNVTSTHVATELELIAECKHNKHLSYGFGWAHLFPGTFLNESTPGRNYNYPFAYSTYVF